MSEAKERVSDRVRRQLEAYIRQQLILGNTKLPREEELCKLFNTSRITLRKVLSQLAAVGVVVRYHGRGTFINPAHSELKINLIKPGDLSHVIEKSGRVYRSMVTNFQLREATEEEARVLNLNTMEQVIEIDKIFYADEKPALACHDILPGSVMKMPIPEEELGESIFILLKKYGHKQVAWDTMEFGVRDENDLPLEVRNAFSDSVEGLLKFVVVNYTKDNQPILYSQDTIDPSVVTFHLIRQHD